MGSTIISGISDLCGRCVPEVLETMFFAMAIENEQAQTSDEAVSVRVLFRGAPSGEFGLRADPGLLATLGAAFLGKFDDEPLTPAEVSQTACELANMVCGSVLSEAESDCGFDLDEPQIDAHAFGDGPPDCEMRFELDTGGAMEIRFRFAEPAPASAS